MWMGRERATWNPNWINFLNKALSIQPFGNKFKYLNKRKKAKIKLYQLGLRIHAPSNKNTILVGLWKNKYKRYYYILRINISFFLLLYHCCCSCCFLCVCVSVFASFWFFSSLHTENANCYLGQRVLLLPNNSPSTPHWNH